MPWFSCFRSNASKYAASEASSLGAGEADDTHQVGRALGDGVSLHRNLPGECLQLARSAVLQQIALTGWRRGNAVPVLSELQGASS